MTEEIKKTEDVVELVLSMQEHDRDSATPAKVSTMTEPMYDMIPIDGSLAPVQDVQAMINIADTAMLDKAARRCILRCPWPANCATC